MKLDVSLLAPESYADTNVTADATGMWPPDPTIITHTIVGALADRIRSRMGADSTATVTLTEMTVYGGTDWTQDNATEFTIECDGRKVVFNPTSATADWQRDAERGYDSVFARFDAWLQAAERPVELFAEWFVLHAEAGRFVQYRSNPDTILTRVAGELHFRPDHLSLNGEGDSFGRIWELDIVASADKSDFARVYNRTTLCWAEGLTITPEVAREVLYEITDALMPGRSHV